MDADLRSVAAARRAEPVVGSESSAHAGRRLDTVGIGQSDLDDARRAMDAIVQGAR